MFLEHLLNVSGEVSLSTMSFFSSISDLHETRLA